MFLAMEPGISVAPRSSWRNHLGLICGLPSSLTYFVADLCRDMLSRKHGACEVMVVNALSAGAMDQIASAAGPGIFLSDSPDASLADFVRLADFTVLIVDQDYAAACDEFMAARGANLQATVRVMARAQIGLNAIADIPRSRMLAVSEEEPASTLVARVASALGFGKELWHTVVAEGDLGRPLKDVLDERFTRETTLGSGKSDAQLRQLGRFYGFQPATGRATWDVPLGAFLEGTPPHLPANKVIKLVGPARLLSFGPYLYLPKGHWAGAFTFSTTGNDSSNLLGFDFMADNEIKFESEFLITKDAKFTLEFDFNIRDPYLHFEFRTFLRSGSISGELTPLILRLTTTA